MGRWMFELIKWYIDAVDEQGRSAIGYWTDLRWGPVAVRWEGLSLHQPGGAAVHRSGFGAEAGPARVEAPAASGPPLGDEITWRSPSLSCDVRCQPWTSPFSARLHQTDHGALDWTCEAPAATVSFTTAGPTITSHAGAQPTGALRQPFHVVGAGYAERLVLTLPPWRLPISELRWGRWSCSSSRRSVVWIDWRGPRPLTLVLVDGQPARDARVEDDRVLFDAGVLQLAGTQTLHARSLGDIVGGLGPLAVRLPASWRALEDRKARSVGTLGAGRETGWAIHEIVRFP
jgi:hypothetical protein